MAAADTGLLLNIREMIDLAIGAPEVGVVDFNMLQTVLHCLAQQQRVLYKTVELRGSATALPVLRDIPHTIAVNEYIVDTESSSVKIVSKAADTKAPSDSTTTREVKRGDQVSPQSPGGKEEASSPAGDKETMLVVERVKNSNPDTALKRNPLQAMQIDESGAPKTPSPVTTTVSPAPASKPAAAPVTPAGMPATEKLSLVTTSKFNVLENIVDDLKNRVYGSMPKNEEILEEVRSQSNIKAITDMWTSFNVTSRLEAAEAGLGKLSSLVQDLIANSGAASSDAPFPAFPSHPSPVSGGAQAGTQGGGQAGPQGGGQAGTQGSGKPGTQSGAPGGGQASTQGGGQAETQGGGQAGPQGGGQAGTQGGGQGGGQAGTQGGGQAGQQGGGQSGSQGGGQPGTQGGGQAGIQGDAQAGLQEGPGGVIVGGPVGATKEELAALNTLLNNLRGEFDQLHDAFYTTMEEINVVPVSSVTGPQPEATFVDIEDTRDDAKTASAGGVPALAATQSVTALSKDETSTGSPAAAPKTGDREQSPKREQPARRQQPTRQNGGFNAGQGAKISELEKRIKECCEDIYKNNGVVQDQLNSFQDQLEYLQKQVGTVTTDFADGKLDPDLIKDLKGLMQLFTTVKDMQEQLKQVHETALHLAAEKESRQQNMDEIIEQIELLKNIKLDREDMMEAMAEKADLRMLARKVSHDQFEMACDDLSRGLEHAIGKLNVQEALWQQALDDIQREIETKLDKMELSPVKQFFNNKLKQLQEHLKQMASFRKEVEAAGTKRRLLRDVNCISCDAKAVMPMEAASGIPVSRPLAANFSMKPYLSYELDAIRKSQASNVPNRNMNDWETIDKQMAPPKQKKVRSEGDKHLCNRYCGGSHTVTTPAQRVARLGHFIKQWGPDVLPLSSGYATGDDGRMYKVSVVESANVGPGGAVEGAATPCTAGSPKKESHKPKSITMTPECRCLEEDGPRK